MLSSSASIFLPARQKLRIPFWLVFAILLSVATHLMMLFVQFIMPDTAGPNKAVIEMILVNDYNRSENSDATVYANAALQGGGDAEKGRKTSPLMRDEQELNGLSLKEQEARVVAMENTVKQKILTSKQPSLKEVDLAGMDEKERQEWQESFTAIARRQAEIEKNIQDYNARPRKYFDGPHTNSHDAAIYVQQWRDRVEDWGNNNYPEAALGKVYGDAILTVELNPEGVPLVIHIEKSSGYDVLDKAAIESVKKSAPFGTFTTAMKKSMDVLVLTRTWMYSTNGLQTKQH